MQHKPCARIPPLARQTGATPTAEKLLHMSSAAGGKHKELKRSPYIPKSGNMQIKTLQLKELHA
jgi:hypothetical protein